MTFIVCSLQNKKEKITFYNPIHVTTSLIFILYLSLFLSFFLFFFEILFSFFFLLLFSFFLSLFLSFFLFFIPSFYMFFLPFCFPYPFLSFIFYLLSILWFPSCNCISKKITKFYCRKKYNAAQEKAFSQFYRKMYLL